MCRVCLGNGHANTFNHIINRMGNLVWLVVKRPCYTKANYQADAFCLALRLPAVSFAAILLIVWVISGNGLFNIEQARQFGIPDFVPWPLNTILGFCVALAAGTIILKTFITTGIVALIVRDKENPIAGQLK